MSVIDPERWRALEPLLDQALDLTGDARASWLEQLRTRAPQLAAELAGLLAQDEEDDADDLLAEPIEPTLAGIHLGAWVLERPLGTGGMGSVWLARRADGRFDGVAAVKLLNLALLSPSGQERFRREGSVLARLTHPGIARLLDAGVGAAGQPYLVLEYVDGVPIDEFVEARSLSREACVQLVLRVLDAVGHAHANLVVHRDLKPSNILVAADGTVKLLDFGIAKLLDAGAVEAASPPTLDGARAMTPEYAAPEQVLGAPITTRTDIYQVGAVLYRLLAGRAPFAAASLHALADQVLVAEPASPMSTRRAHGQPRQSGAIDMDLDAIVLKAMRKEPEERYPSAGAFADDLRRRLARQPVLARRQTAGYRARRFAGRHRIELIAAAVVMAALVGGTVFSLSQAREAALERDRAAAASRESDAVTSFLMGLFEVNDPLEARGDTLTARDLLQRGVARAERLRGQPDVQARMLEVTARVHERLGHFAEARTLLERALALRRRATAVPGAEAAGTLGYLAEALMRLGQFAAADSAAREALAIRQRMLGANDAALAGTLHQIAGIAVYRGDFVTAEAYHRRALAVREGALGPTDSLTGLSHMALGSVLRRRGRLVDAEREYREALAIIERSPGPNSGLASEAVIHVAYLLDEDLGLRDEAEPLYRRALEIRRRVFGDAHPMTAYALSDLSDFLVRRGDTTGAVPLILQHLDVIRRAYGPSHPSVATSLGFVANTFALAGRTAEAESYYRQAIALERRLRGPDNGNVAGHLVGLARVLMARGDLDGAEAAARDAVRIRERENDTPSPIAAMTMGVLGHVLARRGEHARADSVLRRAIATLERQVTRENRNLRELYDWLAESSEAQGRREEAARFRAIAR